MAEFKEFTPPVAPVSTPTAKPIPSKQVLPPGVSETGSVTKVKQYVKDPNSGKVYSADSVEGKALIEAGWTTPFTANVPINAPPNFVAQAPVNAPTNTENNSFYQNGLAPIKTMQQALINFSKDIASHNIQDVADRQTSKGELLNGSNSFMNFMVNNYMDKSKQGKQLVNVDEKQPVRMDTAKQNDNFKGILQTITRIGTPGQEQRPDGIWGPRTNNALQQVYSIAYALIGVLTDMGINIGGYSSADLKELYSAIPADIAKTTVNEKVEKANIIAKNLDKLRALYDTFREKVLNNPTYSAHISQEKPLMVEKPKSNTTALTEYDLNLYNKHYDTELNVALNGHTVAIKPSDLVSMDNFKKYLTTKSNILTPEELEAVNKNDQLTINKMLMEVSDSLSGA